MPLADLLQQFSADNRQSDTFNPAEAVKTGVNILQAQQHLEMNKQAMEINRQKMEDAKLEKGFNVLTQASNRKIPPANRKMLYGYYNKIAPDLNMPLIPEENIKAMLNDEDLAKFIFDKTSEYGTANPTRRAQINAEISQKVSGDPDMLADWHKTVQPIDEQQKMVQQNAFQSQLAGTKSFFDAQKEAAKRIAAIAKTPGAQSFVKSPEWTSVVTPYALAAGDPAALNMLAGAEAGVADFAQKMKEAKATQSALAGARLEESQIKGKSAAVGRLNQLTQTNKQMLVRLDSDINTLFKSNVPLTGSRVYESSMAIARAISGNAGQTTQGSVEHLFWESFKTKFENLANMFGPEQKENISPQQKDLLQKQMVSLETELANGYKELHGQILNDYAAVQRFKPAEVKRLESSRDSFMSGLKNLKQNQQPTAPAGPRALPGAVKNQIMGLASQKFSQDLANAKTSEQKDKVLQQKREYIKAKLAGKNVDTSWVDTEVK